MVFHSHQAKQTALIKAQQQGVKTIKVAQNEKGNGLCVKAMLAEMADRGINRVLCEGGGKLLTSLFKAGVIDEIYHFVGGLVIGNQGRSFVGEMQENKLSLLHNYELLRTRKMGADAMNHWRRIGCISDLCDGKD